MRQQKEVEINGNKYQITQFGAREGWKLGKHVAKIMLPVMSKYYSEDGVDFGELMEAIAENLDQLDDKTIDSLLSQTTVNKYAINFDDHFAGNYATLLTLLWEIIIFNFSSIFTLATDDTNE